MNKSDKVEYTFTNYHVKVNKGDLDIKYSYPYYTGTRQVRYIKNPQNKDEEYSTGIAFHNFIRVHPFLHFFY